MQSKSQNAQREIITTITTTTTTRHTDQNLPKINRRGYNKKPKSSNSKKKKKVNF